MAVTAVFKAIDGSEHPSEKAAEKQNELVVAEREFAAAAKKVARILGKDARTADGEPFDPSGWKTYWFVHPGWGGIPTLYQKRFYAYDADVRTDERRQCLILRVLEGEGSRAEYRDYEIRTLYKSERKAQEALADACDKWLEEQAAAVAEVRSKTR